MKLLYDLKEEIIKELELDEFEEIIYAVPYSLINDKDLEKEYIIITDKRLIIHSQKNIESYSFSEMKGLKCEAQVNSGILVGEFETEKKLLLKFSMRHIIRISYLAKGGDLIIKGDNKVIICDEEEKYCEKCGRALPGTSVCPKCDGKRVMLRKFIDLCGGYHKRLLLISAMMVMASFIAILMPKIQQSFIDNVLKNENVTTKTLDDVFKFIFIMVFLTILLIIINVLKNWWSVSLGALISLELRKKLYYKVQVLSLSFINKRKPGELMNRISSDTTQIRNFMEEVFGGMISALITMIGSLGYMFYLNWRMTLYTMALILLVIIITRLFWHKIFKIFHMQWQREDRIRSGLQDIISGMRVVKSFGKEEMEAEKFKKYSEDFAFVQQRNEKFWAIFYPILTFIMGMGTYIAVYFGGLDILNDKLTVGELVQYITYSGFLYGPLGWMTHLPRSIMQMLTSLNRIYDVLDEDPDIKDTKDSVEKEILGNVGFTNVSFGYRSYEPILENIDLKVEKGEMIGLVGASGTGKSTLINLIMRLYDVDDGEIEIDGTNIKKIRQESLHSQIGVVLQETFLFSGSILNNLKFSKQDATFEEIILAAKAANAHDFICKMPDGYNTYVGEHGYNLSGGERQRIAIARAILNDPRLLILDEATSALDTESEFLIQQALDRLVKERTTFAIAHRLSTLRHADRLVVIDKHRIAEVGTHNQLLEKKGIYYNLVRAQLEMAKVEIETNN